MHAVPLTLIAGMGYLYMGKVDIALLLPLLVGSIPGIIIGAKLTSRINATALRWGLALMLMVSGVRLLL